MQQMDSTLDLLNPYHRVQEDTRKRLGKYGLVNSALDVLGVWTLAHVKLARTDEDSIRHGIEVLGRVARERMAADPLRQEGPSAHL